MLAERFITRDISPREQEVLQLMSFGHSSREIAAKLYISPNTVKDHRRALFQKLNANNVAHLIRSAFEKELLQVS